MKKEKLRNAILLLLLSLAHLGLSVFLIYKAFLAEWGSFFLILFGVMLGFVSVVCFIDGFLGSLPTQKNIQKWDRIEKNKQNETPISYKITTPIYKDSKTRYEDEEWNRLDDLYDEHFHPGFDPF